jgi:hypothetical protein
MSGASAWSDVALDLLSHCHDDPPLPPEAARALVERARPHMWRLHKRRIDSLLYLACAIDAPAQRAYDAVWRAQRRMLLELLDRLERLGVPSLVLKGGEMLPRCYRDRALGLMVDVDLLVPRARLGDAKAALYAMDFRQAVTDEEALVLVDEDPAALAALEIDDFQLSPFRRWDALALDEHDVARAWRRDPLWYKDGGCHVVHAVDVHFAIANDVPAAPLFARAVPSALGRAATLSPEDHVWVILSRLYYDVAYNGKRSLRDFAYVLPLMHATDFDWDVVGAAHRDYGLGPMLYYYLGFAARLGAPVPPSLLDALDPRRVRYERDFGWQLGPLFDLIEPFPLGLDRGARA